MQTSIMMASAKEEKTDEQTRRGKDLPTSTVVASRPFKTDRQTDRLTQENVADF